MVDNEEKKRMLKHEIDPLGEMNIDLDPAHFEEFTEEDALKWYYSIPQKGEHKTRAALEEYLQKDVKQNLQELDETIKGALKDLVHMRDDVDEALKLRNEISLMQKFLMEEDGIVYPVDFVNLEVSIEKAVKTEHAFKTIVNNLLDLDQIRNG